MNFLKQLCSTLGGIILLAAFVPANVMAQVPPTPAAVPGATPPPVGATPPPVVGTPPPVGATPPPVGATPPPVTATPAAVQATIAATATPSAPLPATPQVDSAAWQAIEPIRQAIARRDYAAAQQALEQAKLTVPNEPALAVYEDLIRTGLAQPAAARSDSVVRTPIPGVTPLPTIETPVPTPEPTPVQAQAPADDAATDSTSSGGVMGQVDDLLENDMVRYAIFGVLGLIVLWILWSFFRKRKSKATEDPSEIETPVPGTLPAVTGFDTAGSDQTAAFDPNAGSPDFDLSSPSTEPVGGSETTGGADTGMPEFTAFGLDDEEEEKPKPTFKPRPTAPVDDDLPVSIGDDEPTTIIPEAPAPTEPVEPEASAVETSGDTFESLGLVPPDSEPAPGPAPSASTTPTPSATPGEVNLDDIFGNQGFPAGQDSEPLSTPDSAPVADEDESSKTLPTFVSTPDADNPEENVEIPGKGLRPTAETEDTEDKTISFDELFGSSGPQGAVAEPAPEPPAEPAPEAPAPAEDVSIEDALAATLGAMESQDPGEPAAASAPAAADAEEPTESLDERTERMFSEQMQKARQAVADKDWRQAVHVLSIASALFPDNEEAKQMLREARTEKRKAEESV